MWRFTLVMHLCGLRSWDLTFWDTVRTSRRSPAVGSAAGLPTWNIFCISQSTSLCFYKEPPQTTAVWLQSSQVQVRHICTSVIFTNCLFFKKPYRTHRLKLGMQARHPEPNSDAGTSGDLQLTVYSWRSAGERHRNTSICHRKEISEDRQQRT